MERNNLTPNVETEEQTKETVNGFNAYMEIYGDNELITKVCGLFDGNPEKLTDKDIYDIKTFLLIQSGIPRSDIGHTVFEILADDDNSHIIDYYGEDDDEEGDE